MRYDHESHTLTIDPTVLTPNYLGEPTFPESFCDRAPLALVKSLPVEVSYADRDNDWNENYLGFGTLWSVTDYGTAWDAHDPESLVAVISEELHRAVWNDDETSTVQATKIVAPYEHGQVTSKVCSALLITVTRTGYAIRPKF